MTGLATHGRMSWSNLRDVAAATVSDVDGEAVDVGELDLVWWRRLTGELQFPVPVADEVVRELVDNECRATLLGMLLTEFKGAWVSHPEATRTAHNKLLQLQVADQAGLGVPRTLVSQDPEMVRAFCRELDYRVVVKTVAGSQKTPTMTGLVTPELLTDAAVRLSPAIYQELVPGTRHLRICCFGGAVHTALLETQALDWRYPYDADTQPYRLDDETAGRVTLVMDRLGLRMGIVDMKLGGDGQPMWLEVNPQGQFLFLEGMCRGMGLAQAFADFLVAEATTAATRVPVEGSRADR